MPDIVTAVDAVTGVVCTVNVALVTPAGIVKVNGTEATPEFDELRETTAPPDGAGPLRVAVIVRTPPPITDVEVVPVRLYRFGAQTKSP